MGQDISLKSEIKNHDLNHDLTFSAHTINCVCHSLRSMFRVLWVYNFDQNIKLVTTYVECTNLYAMFLFQS
jgi:hypothetical protein